MGFLVASSCGEGPEPILRFSLPQRHLTVIERVGVGSKARRRRAGEFRGQRFSSARSAGLQPEARRRVQGFGWYLSADLNAAGVTEAVRIPEAIAGIYLPPEIE